MGERDIFEALNKLRDAFLAARDGNEVNKITEGVLTYDERLKIGRRIIIAGWLLSGFGLEEICKQLRVGRSTVMHVSRRLEKYQEAFELVERRSKIV